VSETITHTWGPASAEIELSHVADDADGFEPRTAVLRPAKLDAFADRVLSAGQNVRAIVSLTTMTSRVVGVSLHDTSRPARTGTVIALNTG
jgi:hypothetical protein